MEDKFEEWVARAVDELPEEFRDRLNNVAIVVEDRPTPEQMASAGVRWGTLLGLYQGIPHTRRGHYGIGPTLPDKISIFRLPILAQTPDEEEAVKLIGETVRHEIAHHFGMDERQVRQATRKEKPGI